MKRLMKTRLGIVGIIGCIIGFNLLGHDHTYAGMAVGFTFGAIDAYVCEKFNV